MCWVLLCASPCVKLCGKVAYFMAYNILVLLSWPCIPHTSQIFFQMSGAKANLCPLLFHSSACFDMLLFLKESIYEASTLDPELSSFIKSWGVIAILPLSFFSILSRVYNWTCISTMTSWPPWRSGDQKIEWRQLRKLESVCSVQEAVIDTQLRPEQDLEKRWPQ